MEIRYAIIFSKNSLNLKETIEWLNDEYGTVTEVRDDDDFVVAYITSSLSQYLMFKLKNNCVEPREFVLVPMASYEDKVLVEKDIKRIES